MLVKSDLTGRSYQFPEGTSQDQISQAIRNAEADEIVPDYSPMGRRVPLREYLTGVMDTIEGVGRGAFQGTFGAAGEVENLGRSAYRELAKDNSTFSGFFDELSRGETILPTTADVKSGLESVIGPQQASVLGQDGADISQFGGEFLTIPSSLARTPRVLNEASQVPVSLLNMVAEAPQGPRSQRGMIIGPKAKEFRNDLKQVAIDYHDKLPKSLTEVEKQDLTFRYMVKNYDTPMYVGVDGMVKQYAENMIPEKDVLYTHPYIDNKEVISAIDMLGADNAISRNYKTYDVPRLVTIHDKVDGYQGFFDPSTKSVNVAKSDGFINLDVPNQQSIATHEYQHAIQDAEGFASGYNTEQAKILAERMKPTIEALDLNAKEAQETYEQIMNNPKVLGLVDALNVEENRINFGKLQDALRSYNQGNTISNNWKNIRQQAQLLLGDHTERVIRANIGNLKKARTARERSDIIANYIQDVLHEFRQKQDTTFSNPILDSMTQKDKLKALSRMISKEREGAKDAILDRDVYIEARDEAQKLFSTPYNAYASTLGEIEARQAEAMINIPMDELKKIPPSTAFTTTLGKVNYPIVIQGGTGRIPMRGGDIDLKQVYFPSAGLLNEIPKDPLYKFSNINEDYIPTIEELGGLPSPSIGIAKAENPVSSFGEISLIGRVGSFENDPTFAADIYSPRQPRPDIDIPEKSILAEQDRLKKEIPDIVKNYGLPRFDISSDPFDAARYEPAFVAEFADLKGIDVSPEAQVTETAKFLDMKSIFGSDLEEDLGISDALTKQAQKYFARQLPPKPPEDASEIRKRKYRNRVQAYKEFFTDGQLNDLGYAVLKSDYDAEKAKSEFDRTRVMRNIKDQFREQGIEQEFEQFLKDKVSSMNPRKKLFDQDYFYNTGTRRNLEYNMENILKIMTKKDTRGGEGFGGTGGTRALVTPRLKNLNEIKDNRGRIVTGSEFSDISADISNLTADLQGYLIKESPEMEEVISGFDTFHDEIAEYIKGKPSAFDSLSGEPKRAVDLYLKELADMPTEYFEAKPQRAVELSEFYGAIVPKGTSRKVTAPLENAGLKIEYYDPEKGRSQAIKNLHKKSGGDILFSAGGIALLTASQVESEEDESL